MLRTVGSGMMKAGESGVLKDQDDGTAMAGDPKTASDKPSGVLVGVSPVSVPVTENGTPGAAKQFGLLHVLVVDDDEAVRKACCQIARGMGFAVVLGADSATSARAILKHQRIDVLLLDLKLPGGGGLPLLEQVKARHPDTAGVVR